MVKDRPLRTKRPFPQANTFHSVSDLKAFREDSVDPSMNRKNTAGTRFYRQERLFPGTPDTDLLGADPTEVFWYALTRTGTPDVRDLASTDLSLYREFDPSHEDELSPHCPVRRVAFRCTSYKTKDAARIRYTSARRRRPVCETSRISAVQ